MSLHLRRVILDVPDEVYDATVAFWAAALGAGTRQRTDGGTDLVEPDSVCGVSVARTAASPASPPPPASPASMRLELESSDLDVDLTRILAAGAQDHGVDPADRAHVMRSPAGVDLRIIGPGQRPPALADPWTSASRLHAVFVDVPDQMHAAAVTFWTTVFQTTSTVSTYRNEYTRLAQVHGPGGDVDFEVQRVDDTPRVHVDLATTEVEPEAARLEARGAHRVGQVDTWVILRDPAGLLCCAVPRYFLKETT